MCHVTNPRGRLEFRSRVSAEPATVSRKWRESSDRFETFVLLFEYTYYVFSFINVINRLWYSKIFLNVAASRAACGSFNVEKINYIKM